MAGTIEMLGQTSWGGGMNCLLPGDDQYFDGRNLTIRTRKPETRPGIRRYWKADTAGMLPTFWFNQENARFNDGAHTGFWFDFDWVTTPWAGIQGAGKIRFPGETAETLLIVTQGVIYRVFFGFMEEIPCDVQIGMDEEISVLQAFDVIFLFRGSGLKPLAWDGTDAGFIETPDADEGSDNIPWVDRSIFHPAGRIWAAVGRDEVWASDILSYNNWESLKQAFSVRPGDGDEIIDLRLFHEDIMLVFKRNTVAALMGVNAIVDLDAGESLSDYVSVSTIDSETGLAARRAVVTVGEDVWYLGYGGIYSLQRNQQNKIERQAVALSGPVHTYMARLNWAAIDCAAATLHDNYVIFAVPIDESPRNNAWLVYDLMAPSTDGGGAWVGAWTSKGRILDVVEWFKIGRRQLYIDGMGVVREPFCLVASDSDDWEADTPAYDAAERYLQGEACVSQGGLYECVRSCTGTMPGASSNWTLVADPEHYYDIEFELKSRLYSLGDSRPVMKPGRGELLFSHQWPDLDLEVFADFNLAAESIFSGVTYDQTEHDTADTADWVPETDADGFHNAYRRDHALVVGPAGVMVGPLGVTVNRWKTHSLRFIKRLSKDRGLGVTVRNQRGLVRLESFSMPVEVGWHAKKDAA